MPAVYVTMGDPRGIGPEVALKALAADPAPGLVRLVGLRSSFHEARVERQLPHQRQLRRVIKPRQLGLCQTLGQGRRRGRQIGQRVGSVAQHRAAAGVAVLHVEHGVVARLLDHLGEVKVERRVVLAVEHHEADGVAPDLVDHFA